MELDPVRITASDLRCGTQTTLHNPAFTLMAAISMALAPPGSATGNDRIITHVLQSI